MRLRAMNSSTTAELTVRSCAAQGKAVRRAERTRGWPAHHERSNAQTSLGSAAHRPTTLSELVDVR